MTVYVHWYGKLLEGDLLEGEYLGMSQVRIPVQGLSVIALFTPSHVYSSPAEASAPAVVEYGAPITSVPDGFPVRSEAYSPEAVAKRIETALLACQQFKEDHWDRKHNHLRIGALETFYMFWRNAHGGHREDASRYHIGVDPAEAGKDFSSPTPVQSVAVPRQQQKPQRPHKSQRSHMSHRSQLPQQLSLFD